jgi:hypothetical protein
MSHSGQGPQSETVGDTGHDSAAPRHSDGDEVKLGMRTRMMETAASHSTAHTFGLMRKVLHFCVTEGAEPKLEHRFGAPVGEHLGHEKCLFNIHFSLWDICWR